MQTSLHRAAVAACPLIPLGKVLVLSLTIVITAIGGDDLSPSLVVPAGTFDFSRDDLGLAAIRSEQAILYRASKDTEKFCHHPNAVVFDNQLLVMWSTGMVDEDASGQRVVYSASTDGLTWTDPVPLAEPTPANVLVAAGFVVAGDQLVAFYTKTPGENFDEQTALYARTSGDGRVWSKSRRITDGFFIQAPARLPSGRLILAGEHVGDRRERARMQLLYTDQADGLGGWREAAIEVNDLQPFGYTEPSPFLRHDGSLAMAFRNDSGSLWMSTSADDGASWTPPRPTTYPDSTARFATGNLPNGAAYVINNASQTQWDRSRLTLSLSRDGTTFDRAYLLRGEPTSRRFEGRSKLDGWQYPHAIAWKEHLYVFYSINKEDVGVTRVALRDLMSIQRTAGATPQVRTRVVSDRSTGDFKACRKMVTGPGVNQHPDYPGCTGFIGWESVTRLRNGTMLCSFSAGYWHVSFPTPANIKPELLASYQQAGFPVDVDAPTGGRALVCRSDDNGKTWTRPTTLVDTPGDDRHPVIVELPDGSLLCAFFVIDNWYGYETPPAGRNKNSRVATIRSTDGGQTWSEPVYMPSPFGYYDRMCGKPVVLPTGRLVLPTYGKQAWTDSPEQLGVYASDDFGKSWQFLSRLKSDAGALDEPAITRADDGTLVMISRPDGKIAFSRDAGQTWSPPQSFGVRMVAPCLITLRDGTLVCVFGWGSTGGVQIMWSDDDGSTWTTPAADRGFTIDDSVYVYAIGCEMPDGSLYIVYYDPRTDQTNTAIWSIRVRIREDRQGIDILPADSLG